MRSTFFDYVRVLRMLGSCPCLEVFCHQKMFDQARFVIEMPQVTQAEICPRPFLPLRDSPNLDWIAPDDGP